MRRVGTRFLEDVLADTAARYAELEQVAKERKLLSIENKERRKIVLKERASHDFNNFPEWLFNAMEKTVNPKLKTLEKVAKAIGMSRSTVYYWVDPKDISRPKPDVARKIAEVFGVPPDEVLRTYVPRAPGRVKGVRGKYKLP